MIKYYYTHKKSKKILPLDGHIEINKLSEESCIREVKREEVLEIKLHNQYSCNFKVLNLSINLLINTLPFISKGIAIK